MVRRLRRRPGKGSVAAALSVIVAGVATWFIVAHRDITSAEMVPAADVTAGANIAPTRSPPSSERPAVASATPLATATGIDPSSLQTATQRASSRVTSARPRTSSRTSAEVPETVDPTQGSADPTTRAEPAGARRGRGSQRSEAEGDSPSGGTESTFNSAAGQKAMNDAVQSALSCAGDDSPEATVRVTTTFSTSGRPSIVSVKGPGYTGTIEGECIAAKFRAIQLPEFAGDPVTLSRVIRF